MSRSTLSALLVAVAASTYVLAQPDPADPTPLYDKHYSYPGGIPYQVDYNTKAIRGPQVGYNICNSTTENQNSMCQTSFVNHIDDFCLWAPSKPNSTIADTEQEEIAWCTKKGHGTRIMPEGTLQGVQYLKMKDYIQIAGYMKQENLNMATGDYGGELDPHGADLRGNPLGGLLYSNVYPSSNTDNNTYNQVSDWTNFMGGDFFCIKICDPNSPNKAANCENRYDRVGCAYNAPNAAKNGTFEVCDADDALPVGTYVSGGATMTWTQPPDGVEPNPPYTPTPPASSNCVTYQSAQLYTDAVKPTSTPGSQPTGSSGSSGSSGKGSGSSGSSGSGSGSSGNGSNGASSLTVSAITGLAGVAFAMAIFA